MEVETSSAIAAGTTESFDAFRGLLKSTHHIKIGAANFPDRPHGVRVHGLSDKVKRERTINRHSDGEAEIGLDCSAKPDKSSPCVLL